jgi:pyridoxal phosphate enzyme (YggS family)
MSSPLEFVIDPAERVLIAGAREDVLGRMAAAATRAGRDPADVSLVAVTKTVPAERIRAAVAAGLTVLGENRVQEAAEKRPAVEGATWHLVGPLQSNKVRRAIETFDVIQTVDSIELGRRIARIATEVGRAAFPVLLQVNVDRDPDKAGFTPEGIGEAIAELLGIDGLRIDGLMTVGRQVERAEAARPTFAALRGIGYWLRAGHPGLGPELSMGMTDDFEVAIEEGATIIRVGRALFGERP